MLPDGRRLGAHLPLGAGMVRAADRAAAIGATTLQVFGDNPTAWKRRAELPAELPAFRVRLAEHGIEPLAIHAAYLVNLAGPEADFFERSVGVLAHELVQARSFGARFVNVHTGSHRDTTLEAGIERIADGVVRVLEAADAATAAGVASAAGETGVASAADAAGKTGGTRPAPASAADLPPGPDPQLVLENSAGGGWAIGVTIEELARLADAIAARGVPPERVGFCLDTAHLWGAGYELHDPAAFDELVGAFDRALGLERLSLIHLNDSKADRGSRLDRHEHVGAGRIGEPGLRRILTHPALAHVAYVLETPGMDTGYDAVNLARAIAVAEGRPLEALPPEAFAVRSGRSRGPAARAAKR